ncbi:MAG: hypothetical protein HYX75_16810 [Acidobacteria bacterium]|nr:hypothetical protein [Acidobacteriota bacterium]
MNPSINGNRMRQSGVVASIAAVFVCAQAALMADPVGIGDMKEAYARIVDMAGRWEGLSYDGKPAQLEYSVVSGGSAVLERWHVLGSPADRDMITLYYPDGDSLLLTHFCIAKNQPRMRAVRYDSAAREVQFNIVDATNLPDANIGHMDSGLIRFDDRDHITTIWTFYENGRPEFTENLHFTRRTAVEVSSGGSRCSHAAAPAMKGEIR